MSTHKGTSTKEKTKTQRRTGKRAEPQNLTDAAAPSNLTTADTINPDPRAALKLAVLLADPSTPLPRKDDLVDWFFNFTNQAGVSLAHPQLIALAYRLACERFDSLTPGEREVAAQSHRHLIAEVEGLADPPALAETFAVEQTAAELERLLSGDDLTSEQRAVLESAVLELANNTGVHVDRPAMVRHFYTHAARLAAPDSEGLADVREVLRLIGEGETFAGYKRLDDLRSWRARREDAEKGGVE